MDKTTPKVGTILKGDEQRDAIHMALAPVVADEEIVPGQHIGLKADGTASGHSAKAIGIVDPFLTSNIRKGQRFYLWLYPNTITSLHHHWSHPAFGDTPPFKTAIEASDRGAESRRIIEAIAGQCGVSYKRLMESAERWVDDSGNYTGYTHMGENEDYKDVDDWGLFWKHYEIVTGETIPDSVPRHSFFSCSCLW